MTSVFKTQCPAKLNNMPLPYVSTGLRGYCETGIFKCNDWKSTGTFGMAS